MSRTFLVSPVLAAFVCAACASGPARDAEAPVAASARRVVPEGATAPLFNDLGAHRYPITTNSELAQRYFDQGLVLTYGFNHAEAIRSFREASRLDPDCAMCFWGEAYGYGPNINKPMDPADAPKAWQAVQNALRAAAAATPKERALVRALAVRYAQPPPEDRSPLDRAYAEAMRDVAQAYPEDADVQTLYAEALLDTMPWDYYHDPGRPKADTVELVRVLEEVLARNPEHPGAVHYYIHAVEPSEEPQRAEAAADRLRDLVPGAGHLVHMPAHIYLRVGRYHDASLANERAAAADESYITQCRAQGFYPAAYYPHNIHFLWASASFEGRSEVALRAAKKLVENIPPEVVAEVPTAEEFLPTYQVGLARFGRWEEILAEPAPVPAHRHATGLWHYARGLAFAATGRIAAARQELAALERIRGEWTQRSDFVFLSGSRPDQLLGIAVLVLEARIASAQGDWDAAIPLLGRAVEAQDALPYTEPPPWYFPVREALGYALLQAGRPGEAEAVYRTQLEHTPRNGWSLYGLTASLRAQGRHEAATKAEQRFHEAWRRADVELEASIF